MQILNTLKFNENFNTLKFTERAKQKTDQNYAVFLFEKKINHFFVCVCVCL